MSEIRYQNLKYKGNIRQVKRGNKRYLHVRCFMEFDALYIGMNREVANLGCGLCGKTLAVTNGNSDKPLIHKCHKGSKFLPEGRS